MGDATSKEGILSSPGPLTPAEKLEGVALKNGWTVLERINPKPGATGGFFSIGYRVRHNNGRVAFLKAIDFSRAFADPDPPRKLQELTETFNFERDMLARCAAKNLDRVVRAIEDGTVTVDGLPVPYLIFEMADRDIRGHMDLAKKLDLAWTLRMLHHVAVGLSQLHGVGVAHQDLKPSNVLVFERLIFKLADLGRSAHADFNPPHADFVVPGAIAYAPPELRYGYTHPDFRQRRYGADAFLLGNIILFAFTRLTLPNIIFSFLAPEHMPFVFKGTYDEVLPYLQAAFNVGLSSVEKDIPEEVRSDIVLMLRQLGEPDLSKRGHPLSRFLSGNTFSLERYITILDRLAYKAERNLF